MLKELLSKLLFLFQHPQKEKDKVVLIEKWTIEILRTKDKQTYFESDISYEYRIVNTQTKEVVKVFYRDEYDNSNGNFITGVLDICFSEDKKFVVATYQDGKTEIFELPIM